MPLSYLFADYHFLMHAPYLTWSVGLALHVSLWGPAGLFQGLPVVEYFNQQEQYFFFFSFYPSFPFPFFDFLFLAPTNGKGRTGRTRTSLVSD